MNAMKEETDPVFLHNWNYIIDTLTKRTEDAIKEAYDKVPIPIGEKNEY